MALERELRVRARHPLAVVFDRHQLLAAEIDDDGDPRGAGVDGVLDELLDDGGGTLDDFAGGDLVGEVGRQPMDAIHSQRFRRNSHSMPPATAPMMATIHQNCASSPPGKCGSGTFMPYIPVSTVRGMKIVEIRVRTFMT